MAGCAPLSHCYGASPVIDGHAVLRVSDRLLGFGSHRGLTETLDQPAGRSLCPSYPAFSRSHASRGNTQAPRRGVLRRLP